MKPHDSESVQAGIAAIHDAAADWHDRMDDPDASAEDHAGFAIWLAADPRHAPAYRDVERMWSAAGAVATDPRVVQMRQEALASSGARSGKRLPRLGKMAAAAAVVAAALGAAWLSMPGIRTLLLPDSVLAQRSPQSEEFQTAVGERSTIALPDGSSVILDTNSRIQVSFSAGQRRVQLLSGQAWFQVAKDAARPFMVEARNRRITALGTAFDVRLEAQGDSLQITLVEGRVTVEPIQSPLARLIRPAEPRAELAPGEMLIVSGSQPARRERADIAKISGWRNGQVVFDNETLGAAIEELNRYSPTQISLADPTLADLRVSGVFNAGSNRTFLEAVTTHFPIEVVEHTDRRIVLAARRDAFTH